jgi:hypothetical protein
LRSIHAMVRPPDGTIRGVSSPVTVMSSGFGASGIRR